MFVVHSLFLQLYIPIYCLIYIFLNNLFFRDVLEMKGKWPKLLLQNHHGNWAFKKSVYDYCKEQFLYDRLTADCTKINLVFRINYI